MEECGVVTHSDSAWAKAKQGIRISEREITTMKDFRRMAKAMDQRVRKLVAEGVPDRELLHRMVGHLPDLQKIWVGTTDLGLASLCQDYPGFFKYASLMEEAFEAERAKPGPAN
jgi:hypothetical protein